MLYREAYRVLISFWAPGTGVIQQLWVERLNAFRTYTLKQSLQDPFNGDDIIRFFDSIIGKIRLVSRDKPVPSRDVVTNGFRIIVARKGLERRWIDWRR